MVRRRDNRICYNMHNETANGWFGWNALPTCLTLDAPATFSLLHIVVRGGDGRSLWHAILNWRTGEVSGWKQIAGFTYSASHLWSDGYSLWLTVRSGGDLIYLNTWRPYAGWVRWENVAGGRIMVTLLAFISGGGLHFIVVGGGWKKHLVHFERS